MHVTDDSVRGDLDHDWDTDLCLLLSQLEVGHGKKAIVIFVPVPLLGGFHKVQQR